MGIGYGQHEGAPASLLTNETGRHGVEFHEGDRSSGGSSGVVDRGILRTQGRQIYTTATAAFKGLSEFPGGVVNTLERIVGGRHNVAVQGCDIVRVVDGV